MCGEYVLICSCILCLISVCSVYGKVDLECLMCPLFRVWKGGLGMFNVHTINQLCVLIILSWLSA